MYQFFLTTSLWQLIGRLQIKTKLDIKYTGGVGAIIGPANLHSHFIDFRLFNEILTQLVGDFNRVIQINRVGQRHPQPNIVFFEGR